ncbi:MAG: 50S ribosomal protein L33 [Fusobacteria bacterium]|nr:50S ribosomal protein L33 [Fusobacteriota bacterium]
MRITVQMECTECKRKNYSTTKNKRNTTGRMELQKFCPFDKKQTLHKEAK